MRAETSFSQPEHRPAATPEPSREDSSVSLPDLSHLPLPILPRSSSTRFTAPRKVFKLCTTRKVSYRRPFPIKLTKSLRQ